MLSILLIVGFGVAGVLSRYSIDILLAKASASFPTATLSINLLGSLLAGIFYVLGAERAFFSSAVRDGLIVGFCGGFTTFSAYCLQGILMAERGDGIRSLLYLVISPAAGCAFVFLGVTMARRWLIS